MPAELEKIFSKAEVLLKGHFALTSGLHSATYWQKFRILQYPELTEKLGKMIAERFKGDGVQVVAGPTLGGMIVAYEVARQLGARCIVAEREGEGRAFKRGLTLRPEERVLVVDDVLTTGKSVREVLQAVKESQGTVVGIGVLIDRSQEGVAFEAPLFSCYKAPAVNYTPEQCPLCRQGTPLTKPGGSSK